MQEKLEKNVFCQKGKGYQIVLSFLRQTHGTAAVSRVFWGMCRTGLG